MKFCGACERGLKDFVLDLVRSKKKRVKVDGQTKVLKFYDYAHPPEGDDK